MAALAGAAVLGARALFGQSEAEATAARFGDLWERGRYADMWAMLSSADQEEVEPADLAAAYQDALATATATDLDVGGPEEEDGRVSLPVTARTAVWGPITGDVVLVADDERVDWEPHLVFPGLRPGEELGRSTEAPRRAPILAQGGERLAEGPADARGYPVEAAAGIAGEVGVPEDSAARDQLYARGFPAETPVGLSGLERVFDRRVAGIPGGTLTAGGRELASAEPRPAEAVRSTIDVPLQEAAASALAGRLGGIVVLDAKSGEVRAAVGQSLTGPQPPGSTFKIVTTTAALESGAVKPGTEFPVETEAVIDGTSIKNAHDGAPCGGTFVHSFAESCNSVFAPLGVEVGAERLVETAERFGINRAPEIPGAEPSTMPEADEIGSDLELGATAIGQGQLLVTPLEMASITQTIAAGGTRTEPTLDPEADPEPEEVTSRKVARAMTRLMVAVVEEGTGSSAAIPDVEVAGKTGTAEVGLATEDEKDDVEDHAWFSAFAPADRPKLAVAVFVANAGFGGDVAAPAARTVLEAGL